VVGYLLSAPQEIQSTASDHGTYIFLAVTKICKTDTGFSVISNVTKPDSGQRLDEQESLLLVCASSTFCTHTYFSISADWNFQNSWTGMENTWVFGTGAYYFKVAGDPVLCRPERD
jgi:hypothetical protein